VVSSLPAFRNGFVTFGSLNNFCKVTPPTLAAWSRLLQSVPDSRLLVHIRQGSHREDLLKCFEQQGISRHRLLLVDWLQGLEYFRLYEQIDIALDTFPHGGGTTSCDALWMGAPVVSWAGPAAVSRGGLSILSNLGLSELVAFDGDGYVEIARELAANLSRLSELRSSLRARMRQSPLMDEPRFARQIEAAYREMWRRWCAGQESGYP
jgi:predicted O-linked N-acetylglucosamine transferase (SPINDLY family)